MARPSKDEYYLNIAREISSRGTCLRRSVGAIIVKNDRIVSTGYVGAPRKEINCTDYGQCLREKLKIPSGQFYEICRSVHAEENAIINAAASGVEIYNATLYIWSKANIRANYPSDQQPLALYLPCYRCKKIIINSGLERVVVLANNEIKILDIEQIRNLLREDEKSMSENFLKFFKFSNKNESA
ncbi:MAG: hypothetical protein QW199_01910 [Candidatus Pacearchaeota archaeon]